MRVFVSYRRGDSAGHTGRLSDTLAASLGADNVFHDVDAVAAGADFVAAIGAELDRCDAVLAVIGPTWSTVTGPDGSPRLNHPGDYVHHELASALRRDIPVVPVLVSGATMPAPDALPDELRPLLQRQAVTLRDDSWLRDVNGLVDSLRGERAAAATRKSRRRTIVVLLGTMLAALVVLGVVLGPGGAAMVRRRRRRPCAPARRRGDQRAPGAPHRSTLVAVETGGTLHFTVLNAYTRPDGADRWLLLVKTRMTNNSPDSVYHAEYRYEGLAVDGTPYPVSCFSTVAGAELVDPNLNSEAVIGTNVTKDPAGELALIFENGLQLDFAAP